MKTNFKIGQALLEEKIITQAQLDDALSEQAKTGKKLGSILVQKGYISDVEFTKALANRLKTAYVDLDKMKLDSDIVKIIPQEFARKNCLIAVDLIDNNLIVAMNDPLNFYIIEDLRFMTGYDIKTVIAPERIICKAMDIFYAGLSSNEAANDVNKEFSNLDNQMSVEDNEMEERVDSAPVVRLVNSIILQAIKIGASDIHIEPTKNDTKVRMRVDGHLREVLRLDIAAHGSVITRLKIMSSMNIAERRIPLDGRCEIELENSLVDMRVSTIPTVHGEKAVIRILFNPSIDIVQSKKALGFSDKNMQLFDKLIKTSHGVVLVTGPTGSGKSSTLYTIINEIMSDDINIVTIEDPVEFKIDGANQMQIKTKAGLTFASGLRSILRQDPDVIMVGEIRDNETAAIAIRAAITGHLVLSTIHTNDAASTIDRLVDMGIMPFLVASAVTSIIAQRLVRKICPFCKTAYQSSESENSILEVDKSVTLYKGEGCSQCNNTGYKGRTAIHEIILIDDNLRKMITNREDATAILKYAISQGTTTLKHDMIQRVLRGDSTIAELIQATYTL
ncbi:MAG: type II/IV secretion system protein [Eubacteriaceae bacterium]|nr:type II/IV secretion system protein [Eubacteriaceae bacterium]